MSETLQARLREAGHDASKRSIVLLYEAADEIDRLESLTVRVKAEAEQWAMEARAHKSSLHEAYQAVTGATGEPGNWNGAKPIADAFNALRAQLAKAEGVLGCVDRMRLFPDYKINRTTLWGAIQLARDYFKDRPEPPCADADKGARTIKPFSDGGAG